MRWLLITAVLLVGLLAAVYVGAISMPPPFAGLISLEGQSEVELSCIYVPEIRGGAGTFKVDVIDVSPRGVLLTPEASSMRLKVSISVSYYGPGVGTVNLSRGEVLCDSPRPVLVGLTVIDGSGETRLFSREVDLGWIGLLVWLQPGTEKGYQVEFKGIGEYRNVRMGDTVISSKEIIFRVSEVGTS